MPLQATSGAASYDAFGGGVPVVPNYIEDVFSTYLYTGNDTVQTITNGIDLSTKGGAVFIKSRNLTSPTVVYDTNRGINKALCTNLTNAENVGTLGTNQDLNSFNTNGFAVNLFTNAGGGFGINNSAHNLASWTFRKQPKFFDVVTWTGNGTAGRTIAHNLGSVPGCIIIKAYSVDTGDYWGVYHRSLGATKAIFLSATNAAATSSIYWNNTAPTSTNFTVGDWSGVNQNGTSYVAYIFAHDAGGFGLTGTDNVISCGSFTTDGSGNATVNLGYEPQWLLIKTTSSAANWLLYDNMRGIATDGNSALLRPNLSDEEVTQTGKSFNATGFAYNGGTSTDHIYIAIRRGPMKVPTSGTSVFQPVTYAGNGGTQTISTGKTWPQDLLIGWDRNGSFNAGLDSNSSPVIDRLRGFYTGGSGNSGPNLATYSTSSEASTTSGIAINQQFDYVVNYTSGNLNASGRNYVDYLFRRAPSFFDEVCYTGTGSANRQISHNLGVAPELVICKARNNGSQEWRVLSTALSQVGKWNGAGAFSTTNLAIYFGNDSTYVAPTSSVFTVGSAGDTNANTVTYVAYLFATCAGVSKVGTYTGTATTLQVDCGFTAGSRFVLIKRTDSTGDWYVWDSARGIVAGNDPYLLLNSTAAEVTGTDYVDTYNAGFEISSTAPAAINASGGTYIFLAIA